MQFVLVLVSLVAYIGGLVIIVRATPYLLGHAFDEGLFMAIAALEVLGGILIFGAVATPLAIITGSTGAAFGARVLAFFLLGGIIIVGGRTALRSFRSQQGTYALSRGLAGGFCILLFVAALVCIVLLFQPL